jgi:hypothetical protein
MSELLATVCDETAKIEKEELCCQREIKTILIKLSEEEATKCKLEEKIAVTRANLRLLKDKNENVTIA